MLAFPSTNAVFSPIAPQMHYLLCHMHALGIMSVCTPDVPLLDTALQSFQDICIYCLKRCCEFESSEVSPDSEMSPEQSSAVMVLTLHLPY